MDKESVVPEHIQKVLDSSGLSVQSIYGQIDFATMPLFQGGFINFGYWRDIDFKSEQLDRTARVASSAALYAYILDRLDLFDQAAVAEVGCGQGWGAVMAMEKNSTLQVHAFDIVQQQIDRAKKQHALALNKHKKLKFIQASAEKLPLSDMSCDRLFSVEAAQHFESSENFLREAYRVLAPAGRTVITTFFATSESALVELRQRIPSVEQDFDRVVPLPKFTQLIQKMGFVVSDCHSIGEHVWQPFYDWAAGSPHQGEWKQHWLKSYQESLLDYYVLTADKLT